MKQLTLQFEGFADEQWPVDVNATTQRTGDVANDWLNQENKSFTELAGVSISNLLVVRASLVTGFSIALVWFSMLIGG